MSDVRAWLARNPDAAGRLILGLGLALYLATALTNIGFIALDDYFGGIAYIIPAQHASYTFIIGHEAIRSPVAPLVLAFLARTALRLGIADPAAQLKFVLVCIALFSFGMHQHYGRRHFSPGGPESAAERLVAVSFLSFYFLCPLLLTRSLIENLSAPFVTASACYACSYAVTGKQLSLVGAVASLTIAAMLRFQTGVCFVVLVALVLRASDRRGIGTFALAAVAGFLASGFIDRVLTGGFHRTLLAYVRYNVGHSSEYGVTPFYSFLLLLVALTLPPTFVSRYRGFEWKKEYRPLLPAVAYLAVFVLAHSLVPHKEDRFLIPILPVFLIALVPLAKWILGQSGQRWRVVYFGTINLILLPLVSFSVPQNNVIGLVRYLDHRPEITTVIGVEETLLQYPAAFGTRSVAVRRVDLSALGSLREMPCDAALAVRQDLKARIPDLDSDYRRLAEFKPGFPEAALVKLNPRRNARRAAIGLYTPRRCGDDTPGKPPL